MVRLEQTLSTKSKLFKSNVRLDATRNLLVILSTLTEYYSGKPRDPEVKPLKSQQRRVKPLELSTSLDTFDYENVLNLYPQLAWSGFVPYAIYAVRSAQIVAVK